MRLRVRLWWAGLLLSAGCAKSDSLLVPVQGHVTLDGSPLKEVVVTFTPTGETRGSGSVGGTDADGRFVLTDVRGALGAYVGEYRVSLYPTPAGTQSDNPAGVVATGMGSFPPIYMNPNETPLRVKVPKSGGHVELLLTRSGKGARTSTSPASDAK